MQFRLALFINDELWIMVIQVDYNQLCNKWLNNNNIDMNLYYLKLLYLEIFIERALFVINLLIYYCQQLFCWSFESKVFICFSDYCFFTTFVIIKTTKKRYCMRLLHLIPYQTLPALNKCIVLNWIRKLIRSKCIVLLRISW